MNNKIERFKQSELSFGTWMTIPSPEIAEILASVGYDWIVIDMEHTAISINQVQDLVRVIDLMGVLAIVRLPALCPSLIKQVLDSGAHGFIIPMVTTVEQAKNAVNYSRYPPNGVRGVGLSRAQGYGTYFNEYMNMEKISPPLVILQIEHIDAIRVIDDIFSVEGVAGFIVGPYDLSASLGLAGKFESDEYKFALEKIKVASIRNNVKLGIHIVHSNPGEIRSAIKMGYRILACGVDSIMLKMASEHSLHSAKACLK